MWATVPILASLIAFHNSFSGPFIFDDIAAIGPENPTIRDLGRIWDVLSPPSEGGQTVGGRPIGNLSLAINYAIGGMNPLGYHIFNLLIHMLAALTLFAVGRRIFEQPVWGTRINAAAALLAAGISTIWAVHPLQTESVTYVIQRVESLAGLLYLLTLYCFIRGMNADRGAVRWYVASGVVCAAGVATKEVVATAPLMALLYDRVFVSGSFRAAWREHGRWYLALSACWLLLAILVIGAAGRGGTAGVADGELLVRYWLTQAWAIARYVRLALWPDALVFDYGPYFVPSGGVALVWAAVVLVALGLAFWTIRKGRPVAFAGAWFFLILAPSAVVPVTVQTVAEHRMYLPLAGVISVLVVASYLWLGRRASFLWVAAAVALTWRTTQRNQDYRSERAIWADTVAKWPENNRARMNLGTALAREGELGSALDHFDEAFRRELAPERWRTHSNLEDVVTNLVSALSALGRPQEAIQRCEAALRTDPSSVRIRYELAALLLQEGRADAALAHAEAAVRAAPDFGPAQHLLGDVLLQSGRPDEALRQYELALRIEPAAPNTLNNLGALLFQAGRNDEAIARYEQALQLEPDSPDTLCNLANALAVANRLTEAAGHYERVLRLQPGHAQARNNLELVREMLRKAGG